MGENSGAEDIHCDSEGEEDDLQFVGVQKATKDNELSGNWSVEEKYTLLKALKTHGSDNVEIIVSYFTQKSPDDIREAIQFYRRKALNSMKVTAKQLTKRRPVYKNTIKDDKIPLAMWAKTLTDIFDIDELQTEIPDALRLIAECEHFPEPKSVGNVDFKAIYRFIANAMEGRTDTDMNIETAKMVKKCLFEIALKCTSSNKKNHEDFIKTMNTLTRLTTQENSFSCNSQLHLDEDVETLRFLAMQKAYNPLGVPEDLLKSYDPKGQIGMVLDYDDGRQEAKLE